MATHCSFLAWRIPWMEEFLVGSSPWGHKELDTTERLQFVAKICVLSRAKELCPACVCLASHLLTRVPLF